MLAAGDFESTVTRPRPPPCPPPATPHRARRGPWDSGRCTTEAVARGGCLGAAMQEEAIR